ncbi:MAG TPA: lysophospholipid acyltransferase family protein [Acidimicrobiia bacterium]|nr:lysophospholipid acyltransferase family protein [Acidimicrobiia bacterium]
MLFYNFVRLIVGGGSAAAYRVRIHGREHLPAEGGYVLAPSHRSMMDIPFAAWLSRRPLRYMGKASLFRIPLAGAFFRSLGGFAVARDGTDRKALRDAMAMLQAGDVLLVYPEGTRQHGPKIQALQPGAAYLALRAGVPIVPVGLSGTEEILRSRRLKLPRFGRVEMVVGEPIVSPTRAGGGVVPRDQVDELTARLHDALQVVFDDANERRERSANR